MDDSGGDRVKQHDKKNNLIFDDYSLIPLYSEIKQENTKLWTQSTQVSLLQGWGRKEKKKWKNKIQLTNGRDNCTLMVNVVW